MVDDIEHDDSSQILTVSSECFFFIFKHFLPKTYVLPRLQNTFTVHYVAISQTECLTKKVYRP